MARAIDLLYTARQHQVDILLDEGKLRLKAPKDKAVDKKLLQLISENKGLLIDFLNDHNTSGKSQATIKKANPVSTARIPLSFSQERLWFIDRLSGSLQYHIPAVLRLQGHVSVAALSYAIQQIIKRHEVLRTVILEEQGTGYQSVKNWESWELQVTDGSKYKDNAPVLQQYIQETISRPFDLSKDYMLRATLISLGEEEHVLVATLHHVASDGWSSAIMVEELAELYNSYEEGREVNLPLLPLQYSDYAIWQRENMQGDAWEAKLAYWKNKLQGTEALQLPTDFTRPPVQTTNGTVVNFTINKKLTAELLMFSKQQGTTLFMTLLSAFNVLLYRYSGQPDICVGTPTAGRQQQELEGLIGFFVNTLALRSQVDGSATFIELLQQVKQTTLEAYEHQDVPFEKVVDIVVKERDISRSPLVQVMFVLQNTAAIKNLRLHGLQLSRGGEELTGRNTTKSELTLTLSETVHGLSGAIEYATDLYSEPTIQRMIGHFENLLIGIIQSPTVSIGSLPLLQPTEEQELLIGFNDTAAAYPLEKNIISLFEEQVAKTPGRVAVCFEGQPLTYQQLNEGANQLAHYLRSKGVTTETLVPICIERSAEMIIGLLGILKAGGAYVPVDPDYPADRISFMLQDISATLILTSKQSRLKLTGTTVTDIIELDDNEILRQQPVTNLQTVIEPHHLAYIIYTSGSTGKPKGVMIEHRNVIRLFKTDKPLFDFNEQDVWSMSHSFCFDFSVWEMYGALLYGGRLVVVPQEIIKDVSLFSDLIIREGVTVLNQTPLAFYNLQSYLTEKVTTTAIRYVIFGGEALNPARLQPWKLLYPASRLINMYGITETTVHVTYQEITWDHINSTDSVIGKPIPTLSTYILDSNLKMVPVGVAGEMYVAGAGLARGYLHLPDLTQQRFVPNPFSHEPGERMYKTGDLGKWMPDGTLKYLGRMDTQVKIRGYRIELGEIENVLQQSGLVKGAVIATREDNQAVKQLVGYVVAEHFDQEAIMAYLRLKLPDYMVPSLWVALDKLPLTANGKVDIKALPPASIADGSVYAGPRNEHEKALAAIWQDLLSIPQIGIHDNFFSLGGHSLLAMRLVSAIRKTLEVEVAIKTLFQYPTIAALSEQLQLQEQHLLLPAIEALPRPHRIPLSFSQERLWFIDQFQGSKQYHIPAVLRLRGLLDVTALSGALQQIVQRHEVLRTIIREEEGERYQHIKTADGWKLTIVTDSSKYKDDAEGLREYIKNMVEAPFDLGDDYLLRATLLPLADQEHILVATLHHIASDGWSTSILVSELAALYNAHIQQRAAQLPNLALQYADYALWQRRYLQGPDWDKKLGYWKGKLTGLAVLHLPTDYSRPTVQSTRGAATGILINKPLLIKLHALSQEQGSTLFMTLLAAFNILLYRYSGQQDICVGTPIAGRPQQELEGLIGFFVNTLALRMQVEGNMHFGELLQQAKTTMLEAYEHQEVPFERVVELAVKERDLSRSPLFQVMLVLQNTPETGQLRLDGLELSRDVAGQSGHSTAKYDLTMMATETPQGLHLSLEYSADLFKEARIKRMLAHFEVLLGSIVSHPDQRISALTMLGTDEQAELLTTFNKTTSDYPESKSIIDIFEEQVIKYPDQCALQFKDEKLTYGQLNQQANQLAHYLSTKGVNTGTMVPLYTERSKELIIGMLAILKTGGIYVPLDPGYPIDRINYMLGDVDAFIVLTTTKSSQRLANQNKIEVVEIDDVLSIPDAQPVSNLNKVILPESGANVIYTSGSAGKPKGVIVTQKNVVSLVKGIDYVKITDSSVLLSTGSPSFDATTFEYWSMLLNGGTLVLCEEDTLLDVQLLKAEINSRKVNVMWFTSSWFNQLVETDIELFATVKTVMVGGEKLSEHHIGKIRQTYPDMELLNGYGPTENTTFSTTYRITDIEINNAIPIGRPLNNRGVLILDENKGLVPIGITGEICVSGAGVTKGYVNQPLLTAEKFINHPFSNVQGEKIYKTGDLGYWLPNGNVIYVGRKDEQLKIRGYRVEPGEIENVLQQSNMVKNAIVVAKSNREGTKNLVGYIVTTRLYNKQQLINWLQDRLPSYMVPLIWVEVVSFPLTPNGKINKDALPDPDVLQLTNTEYQEPGNELEAKLTDIWQTLLGLQKVGIHDNFFEIGGDSILTLQVVNRAKRAGYDLHPRDVFTHQTIARLSNVISNRLAQIVVGEQGLLTGECGLLPIQQWYLAASGASASHFNQAILLGVDKALSANILNAALQKLVAHHDALRFRYYQNEGVWHQEYGSYPVALITEDFRTAINGGLAKLITEKANVYQRSLNIEQGELIRLVWMQTPNGDKQNRLLIIIHHLAIDGVSWRILIENLEFLLTGLLENQVVDLGTKSSSYRQWYHALEQYGRRQQVLSTTDYWQKVLNSYQPLLLNNRYENKANVNSLGTIKMVLEPGKTARLLQEVPKVYQTEINDMLLCALAMTICDWGNIDKVIIGLEGHGREEIDKNIDTSRTIGWFTSLYPVLIEMRNGQDTGEIIKSVKSQLRLVPDKGLGFGVLKYINKEKKLAGSPRWNIVFNYLGQLDNVVQQGKWFKGVKESAGQSVGDGHSVNEELSVNGSVQGGQLVLSWSYNTGSFDTHVIDDVAKAYQQNLELLIDHCVEQLKSGGVVTTSDDNSLLATSFYNPHQTTLPEGSYKYLIPIKTSGNKIPLFIVAGGGGTAHKFIKFAKMMSPDQPVYILQAPDDAKSLTKFPDTIEKIAAVFLEEMIAVNPKGPYALAGHCTGGLIAYEMARQLKANNKKIHMLAVFDTVVNKKEKPSPASIKNLYYIPAYVNRLVSKTLLKVDFEMFLMRKYTKRAIGYKVKSFKKLIEKYKTQDPEQQPEYVGMDIYNKTSDIYVSAHRKYEVAPYDGNLVIFYAKERYYFTDAVNNIRYKKVFLIDKKRNMWQEYVNTIKIYDVEGDHSEMFATTWGDDFAQTLQKHLDNAE